MLWCITTHWYIFLKGNVDFLYCHEIQFCHFDIGNLYPGFLWHITFTYKEWIYFFFALHNIKRYIRTEMLSNFICLAYIPIKYLKKSCLVHFKSVALFCMFDGSVPMLSKKAGSNTAYLINKTILNIFYCVFIKFFKQDYLNICTFLLNLFN